MSCSLTRKEDVQRAEALKVLVPWVSLPYRIDCRIRYAHMVEDDRPCSEAVYRMAVVGDATYAAKKPDIAV